MPFYLALRQERISYKEYNKEEVLTKVEFHPIKNYAFPEQELLINANTEEEALTTLRKRFAFQPILLAVQRKYADLRPAN